MNSAAALMLCSLTLAACAHPAPITERPNGAGTWSRDAGHGEVDRLTLFPSGVAGFIRATKELPISRSAGRWSLVEGKVAITIMQTEPDGGNPSIDTSAVWQRVEHPYGTDAGAQGRAANDERSWTQMLHDSPQK